MATSRSAIFRVVGTRKERVIIEDSLQGTGVRKIIALGWVLSFCIDDSEVIIQDSLQKYGYLRKEKAAVEALRRCLRVIL